MPHPFCESGSSLRGNHCEKTVNSSHMGISVEAFLLCHHPFGTKIIVSKRLKPPRCINENDFITPRMIDWKVLYLQENHSDTIQLPLLKHFPSKKKKKSYLSIKIVILKM